MITHEELAAIAVKAERMRKSMDLNRVELACDCLRLIAEVERLREALKWFEGAMQIKGD